MSEIAPFDGIKIFTHLFESLKIDLKCKVEQIQAISHIGEPEHF